MPLSYVVKGRSALQDVYILIPQVKITEAPRAAMLYNVMGDFDHADSLEYPPKHPEDKPNLVNQ